MKDFDSMNGKMVALLVVSMLALSLSGPLLAQCANGNLNPAVLATAPLSEFNDNGDGTLVHRRTGLVWQRCAVGQTWDSSDCTGSAIAMDWSAALIEAQQNGEGGDGDWRLPNRNELASILEARCFGPSLDAEAFPSAPVMSFWTSTPVSGGGELVWAVELDDGALVPLATDTLQAVRLVRRGRN